MGKEIAAVDDGVSHGLIGVIDADLCSDAPSEAFFSTFLHLLEACQVLLDCGVAILGSNTVPTLLAHL